MIVKQCTWCMARATDIQGQERCKQYIVGGEAVPKNAVDLIFEGSKNPGERVHVFHVCIVIIFHFQYTNSVSQHHSSLSLKYASGYCYSEILLSSFVAAVSWSTAYSTVVLYAVPVYCFS